MARSRRNKYYLNKENLQWSTRVRHVEETLCAPPSATTQHSLALSLTHTRSLHFLLLSFLFLSFFFRTVFLSISLAPHSASHAHTHSGLARTYTINRETRYYCTPVFALFALTHCLVAFKLARCSPPHLRFAAVVTARRRSISRPFSRAKPTGFFLVVISINKEIPIQGRTLNLSYALINYGLTI